MDKKEAVNLAERFLAAWNRQDVESVIDCYTDDCIYVDPNTRGPVQGHNNMRKYLTKLFQQWKMHWTLREFFLFDEENGGAFLWHANMTPAAGGKTAEVNGMDLVVVRNDKMSRNEVYFDRAALMVG